MTTKELIQELKNEGFSYCEIEEIFAYMGCGHTVESAMNVVLTKREPNESIELTVYKDGYEINAFAELEGKDLAGNYVVLYGLVDTKTEDVWHVERADAWEWDNAQTTLFRLVDIYLKTGDFG